MEAIRRHKTNLRGLPGAGGPQKRSEFRLGRGEMEVTQVWCEEVVARGPEVQGPRLAGLWVPEGGGAAVGVGEGGSRSPARPGGESCGLSPGAALSLTARVPAQASLPQATFPFNTFQPFPDGAPF